MIIIMMIDFFPVPQLLYRQKIPPNQNLSATSKKSLRSALFDLYHRVMWDCLSKVITSESGDSLSCLSEATDIIVHRATPLPVPPIDSPINTSKIELFETDDDTFGTVTGTGGQSPPQESSKIPTPRFLPQWRRFFRRSSDVRMVPAELKAKAALEEGLSATMHDLALHIGLSDRWLQNHFPIKTALYAFPPPELAESMGRSGRTARSWSEVGPLVRPVFVALDANLEARSLLSALVRLHRKHHQLEACDGYFAAALREQVRGHVSPHAVSLIGFFTDGLRAAFGDWVDTGQPSLTFVADKVDQLLVAASALQDGA